MNKKLLEQCYKDYLSKKSTHDKMYQYYCGESDAIKKYTAQEYQESHKMNLNYLKKLIKEEISYSIGNQPSYISKTNDDDIVQEIDYYTYHWNRNHDVEVLKNMLLYSTVYELYYVDREGQFSAKVISPRGGYAYMDDFGNILLFFHIFKLKFDDTVYIDVYDNKYIYHFDEDFNEIKKADKHIFGQVPVSIGVLSAEKEKDTLFNDVKNIQDGLSIIKSDGVNEITNTRAAILKGKGFKLDEEQVDNLKRYRFANLPNTKEADLDWLLKNLNADYQELMMESLQKDVYTLSMHIDNQEKLQSNTSSLTLRNRLINLEMKVKLNNRAMMNVLISRIKFLFIYLKIIKNKDYDYRNISVKFNSIIPSDDLIISQIISQMGDKLSLRTALSQLSFIDNADAEIKQLQEENKELWEGEKLLDSVDIGDTDEEDI